MGDSRLTLTACHPKFRARERIVVVAALPSDEVPVPPVEASGGTGRTRAIGEDIDGDGAPALPAILLAGVATAIWLPGATVTAGEEVGAASSQNRCTPRDEGR